MFTKVSSLFGNKKNRKENRIYFVSLIIAIVAFYVILSLEKQDVMIFLKQMESDAVNRLMGLITGAYGFSLFLIFFLIYFAERYQLERRSHEYGLLLMLGMRRSRLFLWLMAEDLYNGTMALVIGLPAAVFLSEIISLVTAKLIGMGIIGHRFTLSLPAVGLTVLGFLGIKLAANVILSARMVKQNPYHLMYDTQEEKQKVIHEKRSFVLLIFGIMFLIIAYGMAILGIGWMHVLLFAFMLILGTVGTFLLMKGFCAIFTKIVRTRGHSFRMPAHQREGRGDGHHGAKDRKRLHVFTFRQLQENVFLRSGSLTISSLLVLVAISCMSYGIAVAAVNLQNSNRHSMDFTIEEYDEETGQQIAKLMKAEETKKLIADWAAVSVSHLPVREMWGEDTDVLLHEFDTNGLREAARHLKKDQMPYAERFLSEDSPYMITLSGINALCQKKGASTLALQPGELYLYIDPEIYEGRREQIFGELLQYDPTVSIDGKPYRIKGVCSEDIVVDRSITIGFGIILPDRQFMEYADPNNITTYWNGYLPKERIEEKGLMQAITEGKDYFRKTGLVVENYLQNMGRQLFYIVAASYLTIYLALIFLLIANTVISLQYLMQEKKSRKRYHTLLCLGSTYEAVCASAKRQIKWYFGVPIGIAAISSIFGVYSLFSGLLPSSLQGNVGVLVLIAIVGIIVLCVIECIYMKMVMRYSSQNLMEIMKE